MDRGAWWAMIHRVAKNQIGLKLAHTHTSTQSSWILAQGPFLCVRQFLCNRKCWQPMPNQLASSHTNDNVCLLQALKRLPSCQRKTSFSEFQEYGEELDTLLPVIPAKPRTVSRATSCPGKRGLLSFRTRVRLAALESQLVSDSLSTLFVVAAAMVDGWQLRSLVFLSVRAEDFM